MAIRELVNIEDKGDGMLVANFKLEEKTSVPVSVEDLKTSKENFDRDIAEIDAKIEEANTEIERQNTLISEHEAQKAGIATSAKVLDDFLTNYKEEVEEQSTETEVSSEEVQFQDEVVAKEVVQSLNSEIPQYDADGRRIN